MSRRNRIVALTMTCLLFTCLGLSRLTPRVSTATSAGQRKDAPARARTKEGNSPRINFAEGKEMTGDTAQNAGSQPAALTSADFDSDGVPDLVTADGRGAISLYRGTTDLLYPDSSPRAKAARTTNLSKGTTDPEPFHLTGKRFMVSTAPDFLFAGDFNADGHADILTASHGGDSLRLLAGNGRGGFARERRHDVGGSITSVTVGEIGRADGQADVAVSVTNGTGALLLVFEHPEGAFKYKPEIFKITAPVIGLVIGQLDGDTYNDIAFAAGDILTVVHGRGHAYPFDMLADTRVKRPSAYLQMRQMPFEIAALAVGKFTERRGESLALLATDGNLHTLASINTAKTGTRVAASVSFGRNQLTGNAGDTFLSLPSYAPGGDLSVERFAVVKNNPPADAAEGERRGLVTLPPGTSPGEAGKLLRERARQSAQVGDKLSADEITKRKAEEIQHSAGESARAADFMKMISAAPAAPLANWELHTLASDARLSDSVSPGVARLTPIRASATGLDDLILLDPTNRRIQIVAHDGNLKAQDGHQPSTDVISLGVERSPFAVLPMRLNADALSDLVVLREGSAYPFIVSSAPAHTFVVTTTADTAGTVCDGSEPCALRDAIRIANQTPGADAITFNIGGGGVQTIAPTSELPIIQGTVTIDGTTQPGFNGTPLIELKGASLGSAGDGLRINGSGIVIRGLAINEFRSASDGGSQIGGNGISIFNYAGDSYSRANIVEGNYLGLDPTGGLDKGNDATGLLIFDSDDNLVGGTTAAARNVMSGNGNPSAQPRKIGVGLSVTAGERNRIKGNFIGTDATGVFKIRNSYGVFFAGKNSSFGGDEAGAGNVVSGNGDPVPGENRCIGPGVNVALLTAVLTDEEGNETEELVTLDNNFKGNKIGTTFSGAAPLGNCSQGIKFDPSTRTVLGSITGGGRNTISGNNYDGVWCADEDNSFAPGYCQITGNNIGTDPSGTIAVPNDQRNIQPSGLIVITGSVYVSPGVGEFASVGSPGGTTQDGACTGFCNLISGNEAPSGVHRDRFGQVLITNNHIGTDRAGTAALPNGGNGVFSFANNEVFIGAAFVYQDGSRESGGNVISGNGAGGVFIDRTSGDASNTKFFVIGNLVGTSVDGTNALPNNTAGDNGVTGHGITVFTNNFAQGFIGNVDPLARNVVAGNKGGGVRVQGSGKVSVFNNYVGLNKAGAPLGNANDGILVRGTNTQLGGTGTGEANFIRSNGKAGVLIYETSYGISVPTKGIKVVGNSIADNGGLGIDLSKVYEFAASDAVTPNDCLDADEGPNGLQNFPELFAPSFDNGAVTVEGILRSAPDATFTIDFYANTAADPTGYGEGETHIGSRSVTTSSNGFVGFTFTSSAAVAPSEKITATATDANGNTSEFSCVAGECTSEPGGTSKAVARLAEETPTCLSPIVVNITTDESDPDTADGFCDVFTDENHPGEQCSLRAAIEEAKARPGFDSIDFNIPGEGGHTIAPKSQLPEIDHLVSIRGQTQPGYFPNRSPKILVSGVNVAGGIGLNFIPGSGSEVTRGSTVSGLAINGWDRAIKFTGSHNSRVQSCHIGFDLGGSNGNGGGNSVGIFITDSNSIQIGGTLNLDGNVISNGSIGVRIDSGRDCVIQHNKIGTSVDGNSAAPNTTGISLQGQDTREAQIIENVVSGNLSIGIVIRGSQHSGLNNRIKNNLIGTTADGMNALRNDNFGIAISNSINNLVEGNTISGHNKNDSSAGINIGGLDSADVGAPAGSNQFYNNKIGVGVDGTTPIPNRYGIYIENSSNNLIGAAGRPRNKISGNVEAGIYIKGRPGFSNFIFSQGNNISNNDIGVSPGNQRDGIRLDINATSSEISDNTISGNGLYGLFVGQEADGHSIHDNRIGTGSANQAGIAIAGSNNSVFKNEISGNAEYNVIIGHARLEGDPKPVERRGFPKGNTIYGNRVENSKIGIVVSDDAKDNVIGGAAALGTAGNRISGHRTGDGIGILLTSLGTGNVPQDSFPSGNKFVGNVVGKVDSDSLPNKVGMVINKAQHNTVGAEGTGLGNLFIANEEDGIKITGDKTKGNEIKGNFIGLDPANPTTGASGNGRNGIYVVAVLGESIGNIIKLNRIGHNAAHGISVAGSRSETGGEVPVTIAGNQIGVFLTTTGAIKTPNALAGIKIENSESVLIGSIVTETTDPRNVIAANGGDGITITGANSLINRINHSIIGTDESGTASIGNAGDGISVYGGASNIIGGNFSIGNTIAGNGGNGVYLQNSNSNKIQGNLIGVIDSGNVLGKLPNNRSGIYVVDGEANEIGKSPQLSFQNIIGGNGHSGITLQGANGTKIICNFIGTNRTATKLGNTLHGVLLTDGARNTNVGGPGVETGNRIAFNGTQPTYGGVVLGDNAGLGNLIDPNEIFGNAGLGIDIGADGHTPNDLYDADTGPNNLQNYPELVSAQIINNELVITYKVGSAPGNSDYGTEGIYVEFFRADGGGEGEKFLGFDHYTAADYNGSPQTKQVNLGNISTLGVTNTDGFTSTASDAANNTSEFTPAVFITAPPPATTVGSGQLLISELRLSGATSTDEYVELYNNTDSALDISALRLDSASGLSLIIHADKVVPARGHYLIAHATGYTLSSAAAPDQTYNFDLSTTTGLALLNTDGSIIDSVGFGPTIAPHKEGTTLTAPTEAAQYAFVRNMEYGRPRDTDDNAQDFILVATDPSAVTSVGGDVLGAPGPENLGSHIQRNATVKNMLIDPQAAPHLPPNRVRQGTPVANGSFGTLSFRRRVKNMTGASVTQLRFRVVDLTTKGSPGEGPAQADLRAVDSSDVEVTTSGGVLTVKGTLVGQLQPQASGGGLNSTFVVTLPGGALADGATLDVQLVLGVEQGGNFRFFVNTEAVTAPAPEPPVMMKKRNPKTGSIKKP